MKLSPALFIPVLLITWTGCTSSLHSGKVRHNEAVIPGRAMPIRLTPDSTWIPLSDFCPSSNPDSVSWISSWGQGTSLEIVPSEGQPGVWITTQPDQGFGALQISRNGRSEHVPVFASKQRGLTYTLPSSLKDHSDVRIMGAFNGWSRASHPLTRDPNGTWSIDLTLSVGQHPYQLILDGTEMPDPGNPNQVDNGFGGYNSLMTVSGETASTELAAIGFGGNQVHDVRLVGTPGARVWAWWENQLYTASTLGTDGTGLVRIPAAAYGAGRTDLRLWAIGGGNPSAEIRIPLFDGIPIVNPDQLTRDDWESQILYFMMVDRFRNANPDNDEPVDDPSIQPRANDHGGDLEGVLEALEEGYFQNLGVTAIWVSPLTRNPNVAYGFWQDPSTDVTSRFSGYHGYWPVSNTELDPRFGTRADFNGLVDATHDRDMNFILDYVANHVHEEHPLFKAHPEWATPLYLPDGTENTQLWDDQRLTTWFDTFLPTLDLRKKEVYEAMTDSALWWINETNIDGFRHDATKHIPLVFWRRLTQKIKGASKGKKRRIFQIGETYGSPELISSYLGTGMLDAQFDFNLYDKAVIAFGKDEGGVQDLVRVAREGLDTYGAHHLMGTITGNQDRPRFASLAEGTVKWDEDHKLAGWARQIDRDGTRGHTAMRMLTAFNLSMPGVPCIYQGDEYADVGGNDPDNRRMMRFDALDAQERETRNHVSTWSALRRSRMSMMYGQTTLKALPTGLLVIERQYLDESTTILINPTPNPIPVAAGDGLLIGALEGGEINPHGSVALNGALQLK